MDKISIIIPCYNGEKTIRRCLDSVCRQSYQNFEVLFIDDGSCDASRSVVREYTDADSRIKLICTPNQGVSAARNLGISLAGGDYIQFVDVDDEMMPDMLATLLCAIKESNAEIAVCNFKGNPLFFAHLEDRLFDFHIISDLLEYYQETFCVLPPWNKLFRREVVATGFDEEVHFAEDELFNLSVMKNVRRVVCVGKPLYHYHFAPADETAEDRGAGQKDEKSCLNKIIEGTDQNGKNSVWYKGTALLPKRRAILEAAVADGRLEPGQVDDLLYTRVFDFLFWEMSAFAYIGADRQVLYCEVYNVLREPDFIRSVEVQRKYGVQFVKPSKRALKSLSQAFVDACLFVHRDIRENSLDINFYDVFVMVFLFIFCRQADRICTDYNRLYSTMRALYDNTSPEARYINGILSAARAGLKVTTA